MLYLHTVCLHICMSSGPAPADSTSSDPEFSNPSPAMSSSIFRLSVARKGPSALRSHRCGFSTRVISEQSGTAPETIVRPLQWEKQAEQMSWVYLKQAVRAQSSWKARCARSVRRIRLSNPLSRARSHQRARPLGAVGRLLSVAGRRESPPRYRSRFAGAIQPVRGVSACRKSDRRTFQERNGKMRRGHVARGRRARRGRCGAVGLHREAKPCIELRRAQALARRTRGCCQCPFWSRRHATLDVRLDHCHRRTDGSKESGDAPLEWPRSGAASRGTCCHTLRRIELGIWGARRRRGQCGRRLPLLPLSSHQARLAPCDAFGDPRPKALGPAGGCRIRDAATGHTCYSMEARDHPSPGQSLSVPRYVRRPRAAARVSSAARKDLYVTPDQCREGECCVLQ